VSGYGLDDRAIEVRFPEEAKDFSSSLCVQTGSGAHPASRTMGTGGKARPGRDVDHSPPSSAEGENEQELYLFSPQAPPWRVAGLLYFFLIIIMHWVDFLEFQQVITWHPLLVLREYSSWLDVKSHFCGTVSSTVFCFLISLPTDKEGVLNSNYAHFVTWVSN
jgi:hypothetical protein